MRVYDPTNDKFDLLFTIDSHFITDWHTLTYLALEDNGQHLAFVSENGYLFVYNMI